MRVRRVGFRAGTDDELAALHAVGAPIEAERLRARVPQPLDSYVAWARSLPTAFDDHAWLAEAADGTPVASAFCWSNSAGDPLVMECDLFVRHDRRRAGIGSLLFAAIREETVNDGRPLLTWSTFDAVPAGEAFSRRLGARPARVSRTSELALADVDWRLLEGWARAERARQRGYRLEMVDGVFPEHLRADAATFHHIMQTAPRDDLDVGDVMIDVDFVAELDRHLVATGTTRWTALVREPGGACVGGTEILFQSWDPTTVLQGNTGIHPAHRGLGLAKWAKAAMLRRIRHGRPGAAHLRTDNAFSNAAMVAINDALGFQVISTRTEWQGQPDALVATNRN